MTYLAMIDNQLQNESSLRIKGGAVVQRVERWTCDQQVVGLNPRGKSCVTTMDKLLTSMCLCHQTV